MVIVNHVSKSYGKKIVLRDVSFEAKPGEQIAFIGKNGSGKSTLLQILSGVITSTKGEILYFGNDAIHNRKNFAKYCGYLPQENPLMEELSVQDNISLWSGKCGKPNDLIRRMFELDDILGLQVRKLSGGMKRRVSIACAVVHMPPIVLMDEPTSALDSYYKKCIHEWMQEYRKMNGIILLATHEEEEIKESSRCVLLSEEKSNILE